jgi:hypothetical protein
MGGIPESIQLAVRCAPVCHRKDNSLSQEHFAMRPRLRWFLTAILWVVAFALSSIVGSSSQSHAYFDVASAAAADNSVPPVPGDVSTPTLIPPAPAPGGDAVGASQSGEALSQGPVHEAFAKPLELDPQPGPIVRKQPPDPIKEIPPQQQPEGDNIVWIPGYWAWDDDRQDFLWVSGVLRAAPPGQTWVPGYWSKVDGGFQWTSGLWTAAAKQEVAYVPQPPQSLENGPSSPQPADNQFWIPGTYVYQNSNYYWRPGYWTVARPNWIWVPSHYSWTPGGYMFVDGYWDYELTRRGCLFAPVYFAQPVYAQPAFVFTPSVVFNIGLFNDNLFVRPAFGAYYFGDYFAPRYASIGFAPWFSITIGNRPRFDPLFTYYRWHNSIADRDWLAHTQQHFQTLQRDAALRPPHTFAAEQQWLKNNPGARPGNMALVSNLKDVAKDPSNTGMKFHDVSLADRQALANRGNELQQVAQQRIAIERNNNSQSFSGRGQTGAATAGSSNSAHALVLNNSGAGNASAASGMQPKLRLPTAAASKVTLSSNTASGDISQTESGSNRKFDNPTFDGQSNQQNNFNQSNSKAIQRPSLIQPGDGLQSGGAESFANPSPRNPMFPNSSAPTGSSGAGAAKGNNHAPASGGGNNKDKDDKKNKTSYDTSPHPYTDYQVAKPSLIDVEENSKADRKASKAITSLSGGKNSKASSSGLELSANEKPSDSADDNDDTTGGASKAAGAKKSKTYAYQPPPLFRKNTGSEMDPRLRWLLGNQKESATPESDQSQATDGGAPETDPRSTEPQDDAGPSGKLSTGRPNNSRAAAPQGPAPAGNPALSKFDYQTLFERGRSLSTRTSYAANPLATPADNNFSVPGPAPRATKDPVSSIGGGVGGGEGRSMYGSQGLTTGMNAGYTSGMPIGPLSSGADAALPHGSGSYIPNSSLPQLPHFDLHMSKPTGPAALPDPGARSYDPARGY